MTVSLRSFAKINLGLCIGPLRSDGFHELRTVYQTIALHDRVSVRIVPGEGVEIRCEDKRVPKDSTNTCYRIAERTMAALGAKGRVVIEIEKRLPVQGGVGGASGNAVAALCGIEAVLKERLPGAERLKIAAAVGSDLPLFLVGGTVLGVGRGEEVYPLPALPATDCVVAFPEIGVSTPGAFADWDLKIAPKLTASNPSARIDEFSRTLSMWLSGPTGTGNVVTTKTGSNRSRSVSGAPAWGGGRVGNPLLRLVQAGIANDFEEVVFPQHPELHEVKSALEQAGAKYASLSGSGAAVFGLFGSKASAAKAVLALKKRGVKALATKTLTRSLYWKKLLVR
jgi:4-diphosphocytidyl-2-C-methyl-D-erythritol kinase